MIKNFLQNVFLKSGFQIRKKNKFFIDPNHFKILNINQPDWNLIIKSEKNVKKKNKDLLTNIRFYSLIQNLSHILRSNKNLEDIVELETWNGHSALIIAKLIKKFKKKINLHIFDSFQGLSNPHKIYDQTNQIKERFIGNEKFVRKILKNYKFTKIYPGWIPEKFYLLKNKKFSLIHIDLCLYKPTLESLNFFYPRLVKGGILISNVYNSNIFKGETKAFDQFFKYNKYSFMYKHAFNTAFVIK